MEDEPGLGSPSEAKWMTFAEMADELCAVYMSMGVPYNEYWHGDYTQLKYYAEAHRISVDRENYNAWLQGAYVYDALCAVSPVLNAFAKRGTKPAPYHKEPYGAKPSETLTETNMPTKTNEEIQALNASAKFASFMTQWNKRFEGKGGEANGDNDRPVTN